VTSKLNYLLNYPWRLFRCITCERVPGSPPPYGSSSSCGGRAWERGYSSLHVHSQSQFYTYYYSV